MPGFDVDVTGGGGTLYATNVDFTGNSFTSGTPQMVSNGQLMIGNAATPRIRIGTLTSPNGTVTIGYSAPNITLDITGASNAIEKINLQTGTTPCVPAGGIITFNGATVAAGTNPVRTNGTAANTMALQVQFSQAIAATNATNVGLSAFNSAQFTVDANGFVSTSGSAVMLTLTGNSGGAVSPSAGNINTVGTGSITIVGNPGTNTTTTQLTGLTANAVLYGQGTATVGLLASGTTGQVLQTNTGAAPTYSTATYPSTTTINQILFSSANNTVGGLTTANNGVLTTGTSGTPVITALASNGQLIIGSGSGAPAAATLTAGAGIAITNAANSITIAVTGAGFTWTETSGAFNAVKENGYFITTTATATLPASPTEGDTIKFSSDTTNILTITGNTGQTLRFGSAVSAAAGTAASTARGDSCELVYKSTGTTWLAINFVGNWVIT